MKLKRVKSVFVYRDTKRLVEHDILTKFNPVYINKTIKVLSEQINDMYHLSTSHTETGDIGLRSVSVSVDELVIWIVEQKNALERYKTRSEIYMKILQRVIARYPLNEQQCIKKYLATNGVIYHGFKLKTLIKDLEKEIN